MKEIAVKEILKIKNIAARLLILPIKRKIEATRNPRLEKVKSWLELKFFILKPPFLKYKLKKFKSLGLPSVSGNKKPPTQKSKRLG